MVSSLSPQQFRQPDQPDLVSSYLGGQRMAQGNQIQQQNIQQNQQQISKADYEQAVQRLGVINRLATKAKELSPDKRFAFVQSINPEMLQSVGIDPKTVSSVQLDDNSLDALVAQTGAALPQQKTTGEAASFNEMTKGLSDADKEKARRVALGLDPRMQGSAAITIANQGLTEKIGGSEASIAGQKRGAENAQDIYAKPIIARDVAQAEANVEAANKPSITKAVTAAGNEADAESKAKLSAQKNANALAVYEQGISSVRQSLENTTTGPLLGKSPAITAEQQIAEGSLAAMAPVLKSLFREAGEGTFTKEDQQVLMDMLPTRKDLPAARDAKLKNVDALIKIKLSSPNQGAISQGSPIQPEGGKTLNVGKYKVQVN